MEHLKLVLILCIAIVAATSTVNALSLQKDVCGNGEAPLAGYFCGRGINRRDCPSTHRCVIAPNDAYAVCCPLPQQQNMEMIADSTANKPGSCPPPSGLIGICIARCTTDNDCPGDSKCCGSCPRQCSKAIF
jgi:hypothetical protein